MKWLFFFFWVHIFYKGLFLSYIVPFLHPSAPFSSFFFLLHLLPSANRVSPPLYKCPSFKPHLLCPAGALSPYLSSIELLYLPVPSFGPSLEFVLHKDVPSISPCFDHQLSLFSSRKTSILGYSQLLKASLLFSPFPPHPPLHFLHPSFLSCHFFCSGLILPYV